MAIVVPQGQRGGYASSIVLNQNAVVPSPASLTHAETTSLPMNTLMAGLSLGLLKFAPGQNLAVTDGPGAYEGYVIELAKNEGLTFIVDAKSEAEELLKKIRVDIAIPRGEGFAESVREHFPDGVDGIADGSLLNELAITAVKDGGSFTSTRGFKGESQRDIGSTTTWVTKYNEDFQRLDRIRELVNRVRLRLGLRLWFLRKMPIWHTRGWRLVGVVGVGSLSSELETSVMVTGNSKPDVSISEKRIPHSCSVSNPDILFSVEPVSPSHRDVALRAPFWT